MSDRIRSLFDRQGRGGAKLASPRSHTNWVPTSSLLKAGLPPTVLFEKPSKIPKKKSEKIEEKGVSRERHS